MNQEGYYKIWQSIHEYTQNHKPEENLDVSLSVKEYRNSINNEIYSLITLCIDAISKALDEKRQFIQDNGEVVDISRVKKVSKDTITHLSKHSNLLEPNGDEVHPTKLYVTSKETDYAVYENKLLYTLLFNLKDYLNENISTAEKYNAKKEYFLKVRSQDNREVNLELNGDVFEGSSDKINLATLYSLVDQIDSLMSTPLMKESSELVQINNLKASSNILKNDIHFNQAIESYTAIVENEQRLVKSDFINEEHTKNEREIRESFEFIVNLMQETLKGVVGDFEAFKAKIEKYAEERRKKELDFLDGVISPSNLDAAIKRERELYKTLKVDYEIVSHQLTKTEKKVTELEEEKTHLQDQLKAIDTSLNETVNNYEQKLKEKDDSLNETINNYNQKLKDQEELLNKRKEEEISRIKERHNRDVDEKISIATSNYQKEVTELSKEVESLSAKNADLQNDVNEYIIRAQIDVKKVKSVETEYQNKIFDIKTEYEKEMEKLNELVDELEAKNKALMVSLNIDEDIDYTTKENFTKLEKQYTLFKKYFNEQWKETKKSIKKRVYGKEE